MCGVVMIGLCCYVMFGDVLFGDVMSCSVMRDWYVVLCIL